MYEDSRRDTLIGMMVSIMPAKVAHVILAQQGAFISERRCLNILSILIERSPLNGVGGHKLLNLYTESASKMPGFSASLYVSGYLAMVFKHKNESLKLYSRKVSFADIMSPIAEYANDLDKVERKNMLINLWHKLCVTYNDGRKDSAHPSGTLYDQNHRDSIADLLKFLKVDGLPAMLLRGEVFRALAADQEIMAVEMANCYMKHNDAYALMDYINERLQNKSLDKDLIQRIKRQIPALEHMHFSISNEHLQPGSDSEVSAYDSTSVNNFYI